MNKQKKDNMLENQSLNGKRLLILGGNALSCDIVRCAQEMGIYTIVTDWYEPEKSSAKRIADEYWMDSIADVELLARKIKKYYINGVITGYTDSYLLHYQRICELAGLPCYATKEVFEKTMDKAVFKQICRENGVPVIPEYELSTFDPRTISKENVIIIKPVDNSGSRGVITCDFPDDFQRCLDYALSFSAKKEVVIEKYMTLDSFAVSYTIQDGIFSLSTMDDRMVHKAENGAVTSAGIYPSKYLDAYLKTMDEKVRMMYWKMGVRNGVVALQGFTDGKTFYVMEMAHRLTGGQHYVYSKLQNNISSLERLIHFAVTGRMADFCIARRDNARFRNLCCHVSILGRKGTVAKIVGFDYLQHLPETVHIQLMKKIGDIVGDDGTTAQRLVSIHLVAKDRADFSRIISDIQREFHVYDEKGNDLVLELLK